MDLPSSADIASIEIHPPEVELDRYRKALELNLKVLDLRRLAGEITLPGSNPPGSDQMLTVLDAIGLHLETIMTYVLEVEALARLEYEAARPTATVHLRKPTEGDEA